MNFAQGSVVLAPKGQGPAAANVRAVWRAADKHRAVPIPAGTYHVVNYAIETEKDGAFWCLSGSGPSGREVVVKAGEPTKLEISTAVHVELHTRTHRHGAHGTLQAMLGITGDSGMGLSVIKGEDRVPVRFEVRDADGKRLDGAPMAYG